MKNVWTIYYEGNEYTHFKNGRDAAKALVDKGRTAKNGWTLRDDLGGLIDDEDIMYLATH